MVTEERQLEFYVQRKHTATYGYRVIATSEEEAKRKIEALEFEEGNIEKETKRFTLAWPVAEPKYLKDTKPKKGDL